MPKKFEVELYNVLSVNSGEPDFLENTDDNIKIKNAVIISMGWKPENRWQTREPQSLPWFPPNRHRHRL